MKSGMETGSKTGKRVERRNRLKITTLSARRILPRKLPSDDSAMANKTQIKNFLKTKNSTKQKRLV